MKDGSYYVVPSVRPSVHPLTFRDRSINLIPFKIWVYGSSGPSYANIYVNILVVEFKRGRTSRAQRLGISHGSVSTLLHVIVKVCAS